MEKYSKHLEQIVAERTNDLTIEKQRTDRLLYSGYLVSTLTIFYINFSINIHLFNFPVDHEVQPLTFLYLLHSYTIWLLHVLTVYSSTVSTIFKEIDRIPYLMNKSLMIDFRIT